MEQRRRKSFFGAGYSGGGSALPVLSPTSSPRRRARSSAGRGVMLTVLLLVLTAGAVYFFWFRSAPLDNEEHSRSMLHKYEKMTPDELKAHREKRMAQHRAKIATQKRQPVPSKATLEERRQRQAAREAKESAREAAVETEAIDKSVGESRRAAAPSEFLYPPKGKHVDQVANDKRAAEKPVDRSARAQASDPLPPNKRVPKPVSSGRQDISEASRAQGRRERRKAARPRSQNKLANRPNMPDSPEDLKARREANARRKQENEREMARRRKDIEKRKAAYDQEVRQRKAEARARGQAQANAARKAASEKMAMLNQNK